MSEARQDNPWPDIRLLPRVRHMTMLGQATLGDFGQVWASALIHRRHRHSTHTKSPLNFRKAKTKSAD